MKISSRKIGHIKSVSDSGKFFDIEVHKLMRQMYQRAVFTGVREYKLSSGVILKPQGDGTFKDVETNTRFTPISTIAYL